jgi:hypothetical protein
MDIVEYHVGCNLYSLLFKLWPEDTCDDDLLGRHGQSVAVKRLTLLLYIREESDCLSWLWLCVTQSIETLASLHIRQLIIHNSNYCIYYWTLSNQTNWQKKPWTLFLCLFKDTSVVGGCLSIDFKNVTVVFQLLRMRWDGGYVRIRRGRKRPILR